MPQQAYYFYLLQDDDFVKEFCVANSGDPHQTVATLAPDGTWQYWKSRAEGDLLVFHPPDGYTGDEGLLWAYDKRLQRGEPMPRAELERRALAMRVSA